MNIIQRWLETRITHVAKKNWGHQSLWICYTTSELLHREPFSLIRIPRVSFSLFNFLTWKASRKNIAAVGQAPSLLLVLLLLLLPPLLQFLWTMVIIRRVSGTMVHGLGLLLTARHCRISWLRVSRLWLYWPISVGVVVWRSPRHIGWRCWKRFAEDIYGVLIA